MYIFESMTNVTLYIGITVFFLVLFSLRTNPLVAAGLVVHEIFTSRKYLFHLVAMIAILFFNKVELSLEKLMKQHADITPSFYKVEGNIIAYLQHLFETDALTYVLTYFYVVVFPAIMIGSLFIYTFQKNYNLFYAVIYALTVNYMVAIPFYLFFPVNEVWHINPDVRFLIPDVFPTFEKEYRPLSGLDNCFPSLHTSISVTLAVIAMKSKTVFWSRFVVFSAATIIFSIFYLGIHWLIDMMGGVILGLFASHLALRISEGKLILGETRVAQRMKGRNASE